MIAKKDKVKKDDRILEIKIIDGELPLAKIGQIDRRIFQGGNRLHARFQPMTGFWRLSYEVGTIPGALDNSWLSFDQLLVDTARYLKTRNLEITQVLD